MSAIESMAGTADAGASDLFYILSLKWSNGDTFTWWRPKNNGYCLCLEDAGKYTLADVEAKPTYYNDGENTRAIRCDIADAAAKRIVPRGIGILDGAFPLVDNQEGR